MDLLPLNALLARLFSPENKTDSQRGTQLLCDMFITTSKHAYLTCYTGA